MKVSELIKMLEEVGVDKEIKFSCVIESGYGCLSGVLNGDVNVKEDEGDENVVVLSVEGCEDWNE